MAMEFGGPLRRRPRWSIGVVCWVSRALDLLSTKTVFLVVRECFYGTTRFEDFMERIGTSAPALTRALKQLESAQIVTRVPYQEPGKRVHDEYRLTEAGEDLLPVLLSLIQWGDKYLQGGPGPTAFVDADTGQTMSVRVTADVDEPAMRSEEIEIRYNPRSRHR